MQHSRWPDAPRTFLPDVNGPVGYRLSTADDVRHRMNPLDFPPKAQAKAIAAGLGALTTGLMSAQGDLSGSLLAVVGGLATFYGVFAAKSE